MTEKEPHLSTVKESATALRISIRTLNTLIARDEMPSLKIRNRRLFNLPRVIASLEERESA